MVGSGAGGAFEEVFGFEGTILESVWRTHLERESPIRVFRAGSVNADFGQSLNDFSTRLKALSRLASVSTFVSFSIFGLSLPFLLFLRFVLMSLQFLRNMFT